MDAHVTSASLGRREPFSEIERLEVGRNVQADASTTIRVTGISQHCGTPQFLLRLGMSPKHNSAEEGPEFLDVDVLAS